VSEFRHEARKADLRQKSAGDCSDRGVLLNFPML
jgi:hypothetical protein